MKAHTFPQPISEWVWNEKYRLTSALPGIKNDETVEDTWERIALACANSPLAINEGGSYYPIKEDFKNEVELKTQRLGNFQKTLRGFHFLPAGRITAGAGSGRAVTLFNCYVMGTVPDSMEGIFQALKEAALTMQQGGGIGYDFTTLRPSDSPVKQLDADASGPLSFMDVWDAMCRTIMSAGSRRGAMMATMKCNHPDILKFIHAKRDTARLRMFNLSVMALENFMEAVKNDEMWPLVHKAPPADTSLGQDSDGNWIYEYVQAADIWKAMMENTYAHAEPGVLFIDRINKNNNLWYCETISSTNPCGEQPLPPYGACLLGSLNMPMFVMNAFTKNAQVDWDKLEEHTRYAVQLLDSVIDISNFPLEQQKREAKNKRRMGIGITGLADLFAMMGIVYGSPESEVLAEAIMRVIFETSYDESAELARQFGPCSVVKTKKQIEQYLMGENLLKLPHSTREKISKYGIRNSHLTSIAPTGTISLYAGNVSSGGEPIFAHEYTRKTLNKDGTKREELVQDYAVKMYRDQYPDNDLPDYFVSAQTLSPMAHLKIQAALQRWVDSSISKTINLPEDISFADFEQVYLDAYAMGCKGCTTYRPNPVTGSILSVETKEQPVLVEAKAMDNIEIVPLKRPEVLQGMTYKLKWNNQNTYMTINNFIDERGYLIPFEIFINTKEMSHFQWTIALTRMISAIFRRGGDVSFVAGELKSVMDPNGGAFTMGKYIPSFIALLGMTLENHLKTINYQEKSLPPINVVIDTPTQEDMIANAVRPDQCPQCKEFSLVSSGGCPTCTNCAYSKCG